MRKKTLGIITFHTALNYGAVLQAYALKYECEELGYKVHIINYCPDYLNDEITPFKTFINSKNKKNSVFKLVRSLMSYRGDKKREKEFKAFRKKYLSESVICKSVDDIKKLRYDVYIAGSDQIWNYRITGEIFDPVFFLNFESDAKKVIYAASSHDTPFPLDYEKKLIDMLEQTEATIGIREEKLSEYIADIMGKKYTVVLDPTLLAGEKFLRTINYKKIKEEYIMLYQIDSNPASDISVRKLEERFKCKVYTMTVPRVGDTHGRCGDTGPETFLSLLLGAKFLVTNSFHGIALSILMNKQFFVYENGGVMSRIDNLLEELELKNRKVKMVKDIDPSKIIDYVSVSRRLLVKQEESRNFLKKALSGEYISDTQFKEREVSQPVKSKNKSECCGCTACKYICPVSAITMKIDEEGFEYPQIDEGKCIHCGKCDNVCGFKKVNRNKGSYEKYPLAYGVKHKEIHIRQESRSGGAFVALSDFVLSRGGVVYGAAMQDDYTVRHIKAENVLTRNLMQKAKYVQSDVNGIFTQVLNDLQNDRIVMFTGTPCQVAGLKMFLSGKKQNDAKLYCCDLVCHGVPSPQIWKDYLQYIEKKNKAKIVEANFRDKSFGWDTHCESFVLSTTKKKYVSKDYSDLFYEHIMFRPSCHNCKFANIYRPGDITLADFWGIEKHDPTFDDNKGVSLVLTNTEKGQKLFESCKHRLKYFECDIKDCMQPTLYKPSSPSPYREQFWLDYQEMSFDNLIKKYTEPSSLILRTKKYIKKIAYRMGLRSHP